MAFWLLSTGCKASNLGDFGEDDNAVLTQSSVQTDTNDIKERTEMKKVDESKLADNQIRVTIGSRSCIVNLEDNETSKALKEMLTDEDLTISASNYGGFEKVCQLGKFLPHNDKQITTEAGDVMLYSGNQIVFLYDSSLLLVFSVFRWRNSITITKYFSKCSHILITKSFGNCSYWKIRME